MNLEYFKYFLEEKIEYYERCVRDMEFDIGWTNHYLGHIEAYKECIKWIDENDKTISNKNTD